MPHLRHHRRHHSWPHCGSELCMRETRSLDLRVSKPGSGRYPNPQWTFQPVATTPLVAEEVADDAEMAGIVRTPSRTHRMWSRPLQQVRPEAVPASATPVDARRHVHRSVLRRLIRRPPLDKTRSLFVVPTAVAGDRVIISGWMPPGISDQRVVTSDRTRMALSVVDSSRFKTERRHRRCHSEQPRSWREPSAGLWTLKEE